jgi:hypothetical protein
MLSFLANNIEQLDLALEHIAQGDANNARFGLMLTDNVVEITLHQMATDRRRDIKHNSYRYRDKPFPHAAELEAALGRHFEAKVKLARLQGFLSAEEADSFIILHAVRNEVYHVGVRQEVLLPAMARFYFFLAGTFLGRYEPPFFGWSSNQKLPERAKKYFKGDRFMPGGRENYTTACKQLTKKSSFKTPALITALADHMTTVVEQQDAGIDLLAQVPKKTTRDDAVRDTQAWAIAFTDKGKEFGRNYIAKHRWKPANNLDYLAMLAREYPFKIRHDPIPSWEGRTNKLRSQSNPHKALKMYRDFMAQTEDLRSLLDEAASLADAYVEEQIDRAREERAMRQE